jgi:hypothetical protein
MATRVGRTIALAAALALAAGCAAGPRQQKKAAHTEHLLTVAGFRQIPANTPERAEALARLDAGYVTPVVHQERTFYVYPDTRTCECLYVGRADEYDSYLKLLQQEGSPQPDPLPWNSGRYSNGSALLNPGIWGPWYLFE